MIMGGCTAQERAKSMGGEYTMNVPQGQKVINVTWKEDTLWYLTRPMKADEVAETYTFKADSAYGLIEGTVYLVESK